MEVLGALGAIPKASSSSDHSVKIQLFIKWGIVLMASKEAHRIDVIYVQVYMIFLLNL